MQDVVACIAQDSGVGGRLGGHLVGSKSDRVVQLRLVKSQPQAN